MHLRLHGCCDTQQNERGLAFMLKYKTWKEYRSLRMCMVSRYAAYGFRYYAITTSKRTVLEAYENVQTSMGSCVYATFHG